MPHLYGLARLGRDAELRRTAAGDPVANLSLAFNYGRRGDDGKRPTQWVDGTLWGALAEALAPHLLKGITLAVSIDDVHIEEYEGRNGKATKLVGRVASVELAGGGERKEREPQTYGEKQAEKRQGYGAAPPPSPAPKPSTGFDDMDDDIPF